MASVQVEPAAPPREGFLERARRVLAGGARPDDYLPVTPEVRAAVERDLAWARERAKGVALDPVAVKRQWKQRLLSFHHPEQNIGYFEDEHGIIILTVGLDEASAVLEDDPKTACRNMRFDVPEFWG